MTNSLLDKIVSGLERISLGSYGRYNSGLLSNEHASGWSNQSKCDWELANDLLSTIKKEIEHDSER